MDNDIVQSSQPEADVTDSEIVTLKRQRTKSDDTEIGAPRKLTKDCDGVPVSKEDKLEKVSVKRRRESNSSPGTPRLTLASLRLEMRNMTSTIDENMASTIDEKMDSKFEKMLQKIKTSLTETVHEEVKKLTLKFETKMVTLSTRVDVLHEQVKGVSEGVTRDVNDLSELVANIQSEVNACEGNIYTECSKQKNYVNEKFEEMADRVKVMEDTGIIDPLDADTMNNTKKRIDNLEEKVKKHELLEKSVLQQQKYLESLENMRRAKNVVVYGVTEGGMEYGDTTGENTLLQTDTEKINHVLKLLGKISAEVVSIQRLGKQRPAETDRPRPILFTVNTTDERNSILSVAKKLKDGPKNVRKVFLKKDVHPAIRREYDRLRKVEKQERDKPDNESRDVKYNHENRTITIDGIVVDTFNPHLF
jgi:hypothetical protein